MTTAVSTTQDFQERLYEKIRADIGSLMTDEDVKKLLEAAMERTFFTPTTKQDGYRTYEGPPRIVDMMKELMAPTLHKALSQWMEEHPEIVKQQLEKALAGGMANAIIDAFNSRLSSSFGMLQANLMNALQQR